jgi:hypothetical protein
MFWRVASGSVSSPVEAILSKENFTLGQLLGEIELVQVASRPPDSLHKTETEQKSKKCQNLLNRGQSL